jgi:hypothetical protein
MEFSMSVETMSFVSNLALSNPAIAAQSAPATTLAIKITGMRTAAGHVSGRTMPSGETGEDEDSGHSDGLDPGESTPHRPHDDRLAGLQRARPEQPDEW